jgi:hypothetical protein
MAGGVQVLEELLARQLLAAPDDGAQRVVREVDFVLFPALAAELEPHPAAGDVYMV